MADPVCAHCNKPLNAHGLEALRYCAKLRRERVEWHLEQLAQSDERRRLEQELAK